MTGRLEPIELTIMGQLYAWRNKRPDDWLDLARVCAMTGRREPEVKMALAALVHSGFVECEPVADANKLRWRARRHSRPARAEPSLIAVLD